MSTGATTNPQQVHNKSKNPTTNPQQIVKSYNKLYNKSTTNPQQIVQVEFGLNGRMVVGSMQCEPMYSALYLPTALIQLADS